MEACRLSQSFGSHDKGKSRGIFFLKINVHVANDKLYVFISVKIMLW